MRKPKHSLLKCLFLSLKSHFVTLAFIGGVIVSVKGQQFTIEGPSSVCPIQEYTYTLKSNGGGVFPCRVVWYVRRNGTLISGGHNINALEYTFDNVLGPVTIEADVDYGTGCGNGAIYTKTVNITYKTPGPISGSSLICFGQTKSYTTTGLTNTSGDCFFHHQYRWTVPSGWKVEGQSGSYTGPKKTVSIQAPSSGADQVVQIKVEGYYNDVGLYTPARSFQIRLGKPAVPSTIYGVSNLPSHGVGDYWISPVSGATSYNWVVPVGWNIVSNYGTHIVIDANTGGGYIKVRSVNACGSSAYQTKYVQVGGGGGPLLTVAGPQIKMYPNPSKDYIDLVITKQDEMASQLISVDNNPTSSKPEGSMMLRLYNLRGKLVYSGSMTGDHQKINTESLQNGQYILHVVTNNEIIREKVFIEK